MISTERSVAVIGAGVSGLTCAHLLSATHDVTVFESAPRAGGHAWTVDAPLADGRTVPVDIGFLVLNDRTYPRFEALLADLGVPTRASDMSFSVSDGGSFEYAGSSLRALFANPRHAVDPRFLRMVGEYVRFNREARRLLAGDADPSLREWLERCRFSRRFVDGLIVPQVSAVWSTHPGQMDAFPARFLLRFLDNHGMLGFRDRPRWRTVVGGSRRYVDAIAAGLGERLRLGAPVGRVVRGEGGVEVDGERFDEVVLACHSDQALALLGDDASMAEREVLGAIPYLESSLVLHTDASLLPQRRAAWASWNYHLLEHAPTGPTVTYWLNNLQGHDVPEELLVTLNLDERIDERRVIARETVAHPVYTRAGVAAQERWAEISGAHRTHFCGAYWSWGFHEDGVRSGERVAAMLHAAPERERIAV